MSAALSLRGGTALACAGLAAAACVPMFGNAYATTFVFTGLAVAVAFHGGLFNIGGEGQAMLGGLGAALLALTWGAQGPAWLMLPLMVLASMVFGMVWAAVPAAL